MYRGGLWNAARATCWRQLPRGRWCGATPDVDSVEQLKYRLVPPKVCSHKDERQVSNPPLYLSTATTLILYCLYKFKTILKYSPVPVDRCTRNFADNNQARFIVA